MNTFEILKRKEQCENLIKQFESYKARKRINTIAPLAINLACIGISAASIAQASTVPLIVPVTNLGIVVGSAALELHNYNKLGEEFSDLVKEFKNLTGLTLDTVGIKWLCDKTYRYYKSMVINEFIKSNKNGIDYSIDMIDDFTDLTREWIIVKLQKNGITQKDLISTSITILRELGNSTLPTETFANAYNEKYNNLVFSNDITADFSKAYNLGRDKRFIDRLSRAMTKSVRETSSKNSATRIINNNNILQLNDEQLEQYNNDYTYMKL